MALNITLYRGALRLLLLFILLSANIHAGRNGVDNTAMRPLPIKHFISPVISNFHLVVFPLFLALCYYKKQNISIRKKVADLKIKKQTIKKEKGTDNIVTGPEGHNKQDVVSVELHQGNEPHSSRGKKDGSLEIILKSLSEKVTLFDWYNKELDYYKKELLNCDDQIENSLYKEFPQPLAIPQYPFIKFEKFSDFFSKEYLTFDDFFKNHPIVVCNNPSQSNYASDRITELIHCYSNEKSAYYMEIDLSIADLSTMLKIGNYFTQLCTYIEEWCLKNPHNSLVVSIKECNPFFQPSKSIFLKKWMEDMSAYSHRERLFIFLHVTSLHTCDDAMIRAGRIGGIFPVHAISKNTRAHLIEAIIEHIIKEVPSTLDWCKKLVNALSKKTIGYTHQEIDRVLQERFQKHITRFKPIAFWLNQVRDIHAYIFNRDRGSSRKTEQLKQSLLGSNLEIEKLDQIYNKASIEDKFKGFYNNTTIPVNFILDLAKKDMPEAYNKIESLLKDKQDSCIKKDDLIIDLSAEFFGNLLENISQKPSHTKKMNDFHVEKNSDDSWSIHQVYYDKHIAFKKEVETVTL